MALTTRIHLEQRVVALSERAKLAFVLILCERQMPFFSWFASQTHFGTTLEYRRWLDAGWEALGDRAASREFSARARACYDAAPDQNDYDHPLAPMRSTPHSPSASTMDFLADGDVAHILEALRLASDTAIFFGDMVKPRSEGGALMYDPSENDGNAVIHPYAQRELEREAQDLDFVAALPSDFRSDVVAKIRDCVWRGPVR